jgi:hypothetical protein
MRLNGEVPGEGGLCSGVTIPLQDGGVLEVSIRDGFGKHAKNLWDRRNQELAGGRRQQIDWLFAEDLDLEHVYAEQGSAFMIKCDYVGMERSVKIGTKTRGRVTEWADLSDCRLTDRGLWTPFLAEAKARHPRHRKKTPPPAPPKAKKAKAPQAASSRVRCDSRFPRVSGHPRPTQGGSSRADEHACARCRMGTQRTRPSRPDRRRRTKPRRGRGKAGSSRPG